MKAARIVILGIALAAGGAAAYLVQTDAPPPTIIAAPAPVAAVDTVDVLVAGSEIAIGQAVSAQTLRWQTWPTAAASSGNFIVKKDRPNGIEQIAGSIGDRGKTAQYLITSRYVDSLRDMARTQNSKVIFMPTETSGVLASVGAFKEVFSETGETAQELPKSPRSPKELDK